MNPSFGQSPTLRDQLGPMKASLRGDLDVSRVLFQGEPHYVLRDRLTGRVHRLDLVGYRIACAMRGQADLATLSVELTSAKVAEDADEIFEIARDLHRAGLVTLPIDDGAERYARSQKVRNQKRQKRFTDFLFLQIPLFSPDRFLDRTVRHARGLFTKTALATWTLLTLAAIGLVVTRFDDFTAPLLDLVALENLPWLLVALVGLKVIHEFGHAYCCKAFGGSVPEMGVVLFVGAPLAYCDATSSWSFRSRSRRIAVGLAGMYFESFIAILATFVWAMTDPGPVNTISHQVIFLASVTTLFFNLNPLIRFDGYHILADIVEIPNLKARSIDELRRWFDRRILGHRGVEPTETGGRRAFLLSFGVASSVYRITLTLSICFTIATTLFFVGTAMAAIYLARTLLQFLRGAFRHLCRAEDTRPVRARALVVAILLFVGLPLVTALVPVRWPQVARGVIAFENEALVRAEVGGELLGILAHRNAPVTRGQILADLSDDGLLLARDEAVAELELARMELEAAQRVELAEGERLAVRVRLWEERLAERERDLERLRPAAPMDGLVVSARSSDEHGVRTEPGDPIAEIVSGQLRIEVALNEESLADVVPTAGDHLSVRCTQDPTRTFEATVLTVRPAASRVVLHEALTSLGGGDFVVDPETMQTQAPVFEVVLEVPEAMQAELSKGATVAVRFRGTPATLYEHARRRTLRFLKEVQKL
ncbi:MAG: HlyD family efflux transporter periplasmic adaptor subunit [Planctomycetota bacterium]